MDWLTALVEVVKALAWPVTVLSVIYLLRNSLRELLGSIHEGKLRYKDLEVVINRKLVEARSALGDKATASAEDKPIALDNPSTKLLELAQQSPRAAVLESWLLVESAILKIAARLQPSESKLNKRSPYQLLGAVLQSSEVVPASVSTAISKLRDIRNQTVHASDYQPTVDDAEEFVLLSMAVVTDLESIKI
jgi:uncharacterized protein YutE (UPF0331/DUF86 family)